MASSKLLIVTLATFLADTWAARLSALASFKDYVSFFGRNFVEGTNEYSLRQDIFDQRATKIRAQNQRANALWTAGLNEYTDRTDQELAMLRGWRGRGPRSVGDRHFTGLLDTRQTIPKQVDWTHLESLKTVADQGACGSCWAFATTSMLMAHYEIHTNVSKRFSQQQLVDCTPNPRNCGGTGGCSGATVELAMGYVSSIGLDKLQTLDQFPYKASDQTCDSSLAVAPESFTDAAKVQPHVQSGDDQEVQLISWQTLPSNEALPLMQALVEGPVAISTAASDWFAYMGGVFDGCVQDAVIDHAVLAVGFGEKSGSKYWTIMNSWGEYWGERGAIRILRQNTPSKDSAHCGIDHEPKDGVACEPYPDQVEVCGMCGILYDSVSPKMGKPMKLAQLRGRA